MKKTRKKPGPKPLPADKKIKARVTVWMTSGELAEVEAEARRAGLTTSQLLMRRWRKRK